MVRESFARRAFRKSGTIGCSSCGGELDASVHCPACGILFPEYIVAETPDAVRKRARKKKAGFLNLDFSFGSTPKSAHTATYTPGYSSEHATETKTKSTGAKSITTLLTRIGLLVVVIALVVAGGLAYRNYKIDHAYSDKYFRVLFAVKTGTDLSVKVCNRLSSEWQKNITAGQNMTPRITADEEIALNKAKTGIDQIFQILEQQPKKFDPAKEKLQKLNKVFLEANSLAAKPQSSLSNLTAAVAKVDSDFNQVSQELKSSLPATISEDLPAAKAKYRNLKDF
jgi:hypothetical protein